MIQIAIAVLLASSAQATAPKTFVELVPSTKEVQPGKPFQVALHMKMAPGWHCYFVNPGESGMAPRISWHLPPGFEAGPIHWPTPKRKVILSVAGYVYEDEVWLVSDIKVPSKPWGQPGVPFYLRADVSWLLCRLVCVPQKASLRLPALLADQSVPNPAFAPAEKTIPTEGLHMKMEAESHAKTVTLNVDQAGLKPDSVHFFPADGTFFAAPVPKIQGTSTGISLTVPLSMYAPSTPKRLTGILVIPPTRGPGGGAHWIDVQVKNR